MSKASSREMAKPFRLYEYFLIFLQNDKNLIIEDFDAARHILSKTSYFSLISGYKHTFKIQQQESTLTGQPFMIFTVSINLIMNYAVFS